jgi:ribonuclease E
MLLRGRGWPEGLTDPLSGYRAYRVLVVKRALEGRNGNRLLTWEGWPACAELLKLVQPHSRRTEVISTTHRRDRQQRDSRRGFWESLPNLLSFLRGGSGPLSAYPLEQADSMVDPRERPRGQRHRGGVRVQERTEERRPRERRERREPREQREPRARTRPDRVSGERKRQRPRPEREAPSAAPVENGAVAPVLDAQENGAPPRKKRRRRRRKSQSGATNRVVTAPEVTEVVEEAVTVETVPNEGSAEETRPEGARRRRSRRGRRRGRRNGANRPEVTENEAGVANPDQGIPESAPREVQRDEPTEA